MGKRIDTPLTDEQRDLAARYMPIVYKVVSQVVERWPNHEDEILESASDGLMYAARTYKPDRGVKFQTYAYFIVKRRCYDRLRSLWRPSGGMRVPFGPRHVDPIDPRDALKNIDDRDEYYSSTRCMPDLTFRILNLICLGDYNCSEAARIVGVPPYAAYKRVMTAHWFYVGSMRPMS